MRIEVRQSKETKPWYWRIVAGNGAISAASESYATKGNAVRAAKNFREALVSEEVLIQIEEGITSGKFEK